MDKNTKKLVEELFFKIIELPAGTVTSVALLLGDTNLKKFSVEELFNINNQLLEKCKNENIKLNFEKYSDAIVGLPFDIHFIKE